MQRQRRDALIDVRRISITYNGIALRFLSESKLTILIYVVTV